MIVYRVDETDSESAEDRKAGNALFVHELCNDVLKVSVGTGDIEKMFRLGRQEEGKVRPLLVRFSNVDKKASVMAKVKELRTASDRYKKISLANDLTSRQREIVKDVRQKAIEEMRNEDSAAGNFRNIVVEQENEQTKSNKNPTSGLDKGFKCLYVNARGISNMLDSMRAEIRVLELVIVAITESWVDDRISDEELHIEGYVILGRIGS